MLVEIKAYNMKFLSIISKEIIESPPLLENK